MSYSYRWIWVLLIWTVVAIIVLSVGTIQIASNTEGGWRSVLIDLGTGVGIALAIMGAFVLGGFLIDARNTRALQGHQFLRLELDDTMTLYVHRRDVDYRRLRRPLIGEERAEEIIPLSEVRFTSWLMPLIESAGFPDDVICFWDRDPELQLDFIAPVPTDKDAVLFGEITLSELAMVPAIQRAVLSYLKARIDSGALITNVDLDTGEPLEAALPPLAPGISFDRDRVLWENTKAPDEDR